MKKNIIILALARIGFGSCVQSGKSTQTKESFNLEAVDLTIKDEAPPSRPSHLSEYIDTEFNYTDSTGKGIIIQNSYPKGGVAINGERGYPDPSGELVFKDLGRTN